MLLSVSKVVPHTDNDTQNLNPFSIQLSKIPIETIPIAAIIVALIYHGMFLDTSIYLNYLKDIGSNINVISTGFLSMEAVIC